MLHQLYHPGAPAIRFQMGKVTSSRWLGFSPGTKAKQQAHLSPESVTSQETEILQTLAINIYVRSKNLSVRIIAIAIIKVAEATIT